MLKYENLKQKPREFLAATGVTDEEFQILLPNFARAYGKSMTTAPLKKPPLFTPRTPRSPKTLAFKATNRKVC